MQSVIWEAIGELLPAAAVIAGNPFAIIVVVVLLGGGKVMSANAFLGGWVLGLSILTGLVVALSSALDADDDPTWLSVLRLVVGVLLVAVGVRKVARRPRSAEEREPPAWMAKVESAGPARAFGSGVVLAAVNPKHVALISTNASFIAQAHPSTAGTILASAVLVVLGASGVAVCVLLATFGGQVGQRALSAINRFMAEYADVLVAAVVVLIGFKIAGDGIGGLGRG